MNATAPIAKYDHPISRWILVVAVANNNVIGRDSGLPWKIRSDLRRFKQLTMGHCLLMGRKTFDSIGRPLPGRQTIILSRTLTDADVRWTGVCVATSLDDVSHLVSPGRHIMVVGGAEIYRQALPRCDEMWITRIQADLDGDTFFPEVDWNEWLLESSQPVPKDDADEFQTEFQIWLRKAQ